MALADVSKTITAQNVFTNWVTLDHESDLSISGIAGDTVTVQRTRDGGTTIRDIESFTSDVEKIISPSRQGIQYRVGIKTGNYVGGTVLVEINR